MLRRRTWSTLRFKIAPHRQAAQRHHWITWVGLLIVLYVALEMIWTGGAQIGCQFVSESTCEAGMLGIITAIFT